MTYTGFKTERKCNLETISNALLVTENKNTIKVYLDKKDSFENVLGYNPNKDITKMLLNVL